MLLQRSLSSATATESAAGSAEPSEPGEDAAGRGVLVRRLRHPRARRRTVVAGAVAVLVVAALLVAYLAILRPRAADAASAVPTTTAQVSTTAFEQTVSTTGTLTPAVQEEVSFAASGTVQTVTVTQGDTVEEGQTLATIDTLQLDATLAQAYADLAQARADLADAQEAVDGSDAASAAVAAREAAVAVAQQVYDQAEATMSDATLTAPAAGLVTSVGIAVGDTVGSSGGSSQSGASTAGTPSGATSSGGSTSSSSGEVAFTIVGTDAWTVGVSVGESDVTAIEAGDQVEMTSDALDGTVFGTVSEVGRLPSTTQGAVAYPVTIRVTGSPDGLHDGMSVEVSIITERRTGVLAVPAAAVSMNDGGESVVTVVTEDGSTAEQVVETGETSGQMIEIVSGLADGDTVQFTATVPSAGRDQESGTGNEGGLPEGFDPSQLPGGGQQPGGQGGFPGQGVTP